MSREYRDYGSKWNLRVRGFGPTHIVPITSAGDDNQRCQHNGR